MTWVAAAAVMGVYLSYVGAPWYAFVFAWFWCLVAAGRRWFA